MISFRVCAVLAILLGSTSVVAADEGDDHGHGGRDCRDFDGPFSSVLVPPPTCTSPVGLCTHGILTGDLDATYDFTVQAINPDPLDPSTLILTGTSVVTTKDGQMFTNDTSVVQSADTPSPFVTTAVVGSGNERWTNTSGEFVATGTLNLLTGQATGSYTAHLCPGRHDDGCHDDR